jgi:hypothetical protein
MLRAIFYIVIFIFTMNTFAQANDTIFLKEITAKKISSKIKHIKTKGTTSSLTGNPIKSLMSRIDKLPPGSLSSIKFYFNNSISDLLPDNERIEYKDVELVLLIYNVKEDGSPGEAIVDKEIRFLLRADHRGSIELDLEELYLNTSESMYFGFELLKQQSGKDFRITVNSSNRNAAASYMKSWNNDEWSKFGFTSLGIEMALDVRLIN